MSDSREIEALAAYLKLLKNKGASEESLNKREQFIQKLIPKLVDKPQNGAVFREEVEAFIETIDHADWPFCLAVTREFFYFWIEDIKAVAAFSSDSAYDITPIDWVPKDNDLKTLWEMVETVKFEVVDTWPLKAYQAALKQEGAAQSLIDIRLKLVKLLLIRLKDAPDKNHKIFRIGVDATVPLFYRKETRRLFFAVVREFYYFWIGDPNASKFILGDTTGSYV